MIAYLCLLVVAGFLSAFFAAGPDAECRRWLSRWFPEYWPPSPKDWPLGFMDVVTSASVHDLCTKTYPEWTPARPTSVAFCDMAMMQTGIEAMMARLNEGCYPLTFDVQKCQDRNAYLVTAQAPDGRVYRQYVGGLAHLSALGAESRTKMLGQQLGYMAARALQLYNRGEFRWGIPASEYDDTHLAWLDNRINEIRITL